MFEYIFLITILLAISLIGVLTNVSGSRIILVILTFILIVFTALRFHASQDYESYVLIFEQVPELESLSISSLRDVSSEWGYLLLNSAFKSLSFQSFAFIALISVFSIASKSFFILRFSLYPVCAFVLYFSAVYFNSEFIQIRWALALSFVFLGIAGLLKYKYGLSFFFLGIAATIHIFSLLPIFILLGYGFFKTRIDQDKMVFVVFISFILGYFIDLIALMLNVIGYFESDNYFYIKLIGYIANIDQQIAWHVMLRYLLTFGFITFLVFNTNKSPIRSSNVGRLNASLYCLYGIFLAFCLLFASFPILANRVYIICEMLSAILISNNIYFINSLVIRRALLYCVTILAFVYWYGLVFSFYEKGNIYDYSTWFILLS